MNSSNDGVFKVQLALPVEPAVCRQSRRAERHASEVSADGFVPILRWFIVGIVLALLPMSLIIALMEMS